MPVRIRKAPAPETLMPLEEVRGSRFSGFVGFPV